MRLDCIIAKRILLTIMPSPANGTDELIDLHRCGAACLVGGGDVIVTMAS